ncbi:hypothetical protein CC78DRAFT_460918 [Lojkania enalia]|uniref:Uncharacterized protein n=1 Tax=Lojkania enalia TaxID=147567 RepID=A0A9P4KGH0_9PLEO|nr:hypothetical protein CC78DRAFT_460918 [Didymosphaeria enalia]
MSTEAGRIASHGRGGAGNLGKDDPNTYTKPSDLVTPTLKSDHYSTGRGGSGNIARNDPQHPEIARASQDVEAPVHRDAEGPHHYGRGGAANVVSPSEREIYQAHENNMRKSEELRREQGSANDTKSLVEKGKEFLSKFGKK